ncbi:MAG: hypothetical protein WA952_11550 [Lewinella sp.]
MVATFSLEYFQSVVEMDATGRTVFFAGFRDIHRQRIYRLPVVD